MPSVLSSLLKGAEGLRRGATALSVLDIREAIQLKPETLERCGRLAHACLDTLHLCWDEVVGVTHRTPPAATEPARAVAA